MFLEIGFPQVTAVRLHESVDLVHDLAFVISVASFLSDQAQALREGGILKNVSFRRRATLSVERIGLQKSARKFAVEGHATVPIPRDQLGDGKAFLRVTNRAREIVA